MSSQKKIVKNTDWTTYYRTRGLYSHMSAKLAFKSFIAQVSPYLQQYSEASCQDEIVMTELGGCNSSFYGNMRTHYPSAKIILIDQCEPEQDFLAHTVADLRLQCIQQDLLKMNFSPDIKIGASDLVFSFGFIEHFEPENTSRVIAAHFALTKPGGLVYLSFPTPTWLYRTQRFVLEHCNCWPFYDERPLEFSEVRQVASHFGTELRKELCIRLGLTQGTLLYRKN